MEYIVFAIPSAFMLLLAFMLLRQRKIDAMHKDTMEEVDAVINENWSKIDTGFKFLQSDFVLPASEQVKSIEDGFLVTENHSGKTTVHLLPGEQKH